MARKLFRTKRRKVAAVVLTLLTLASAGTALAAWLTSSQGGGKTPMGSLVAPTVTPASDAQAATATNKCFPGSSCDVVVQVSNPNGPLVATGISPGALGSFASSSNAACSDTELTIRTLSSLSVPVPAGTSTVIIPNGATLASSAPTECQGAYISKPVKLDFTTP